MDSIGEEEPTSAATRRFESQFFAAAATYPSHRGGGSTGLVGAFMPAAKFAGLPGTLPWVNPVDPGPTPLVPANPTAAAIAEARHVHTTSQAEWTAFHAAKTELRSLVLEHVDKCHYPGLAHPIMLFANVCPGVIVQHMLTEYATVTDDELIGNLFSLNELWDTAVPLAGLWARQTEIRRFSVGHDEITIANMTRSTFTILEKMGIYPETCRTWRLKPRAQRTWALLQSEFKAADKLHRDQATAAHFANLATTTALRPNRRPDAPPVVFATGFDDPPLPAIFANGLPREGGGPVAHPEGFQPRDPNWVPYCFTCGVTWNANHTGVTCPRPCEGHLPHATIDNMCGGNNIIKRQHGERPHGPAQARPRRQRPAAGRAPP